MKKENGILIVAVVIIIALGVIFWVWGNWENANDINIKQQVQNQEWQKNKQITETDTQQGESNVEKIEKEYRIKKEAGELIDYPIPELGIVLRLPKDIVEELIYVPLEKSGVGFSTKKLSEFGGDCIAKEAPIGTLTRKQRKVTEYDKTIPAAIVKEYDNFFFTFTSAQAVCFSIAQAMQENLNYFYSENSIGPNFSALVRSKDFWDSVNFTK